MHFFLFIIWVDRRNTHKNSANNRQKRIRMRKKKERETATSETLPEEMGREEKIGFAVFTNASSAFPFAPFAACICVWINEIHNLKMNKWIRRCCCSFWSFARSPHYMRWIETRCARDDARVRPNSFQIRIQCVERKQYQLARSRDSVVHAVEFVVVNPSSMIK